MRDGVDAVNIHVNSLSNNTFGSNGAVVPPIDDIQEVKIQLALFDATTGRSGGSNTFVHHQVRNEFTARIGV